MLERRTDSSAVWRLTPVLTGLLLLALALLVLSTLDGWKKMLWFWNTQEAYSYGYLIPVITGFLLWQRKDILEKLEFSGSWLGLIALAAGIAIAAIGKLTTITTLIQYGFVISLLAVALALAGREAFRWLFAPLVLLFLMLPLPAFFYNNLSAKLQLLSSSIGVEVTRLFGISVYLEGNVIDLGTYQLQVVEACSGLNYLFPLMVVGFVSAYFFHAAFWKRAIVFLSSIPITILMNSFRIGVIGVLVEYGGVDQAEGFLHFFEGWIIFMACTMMLAGEIWLISKLSGDKRPWATIFGINMPAPAPENAVRQARRVPAPFAASLVAVAVWAIAAQAIEGRQDVIPDRKAFADFPLAVGDWQGTSSRLESIYLDELKLDDYVLADFRSPDRGVVNLYAAYYATQRADQSAHSPRSCLPGGGWVMSDFGQRPLLSIAAATGALRVNRVMIQKGEYRQLVYYWFQQRGRNITNEYAVKWYLFLDALQSQRSDGALIRLTTPLAPNEDVAAGDARLTDFAAAVAPVLPAYIPD